MSSMEGGESYSARVDASDALVVSDPVADVQPCDTVGIDANEMQAITRDLHHDFLHGTAVPPASKNAFRPSSVSAYGGDRQRSASVHSFRTVRDRLGPAIIQNS
jgi:hypothetical protein